MMVYSYPLRNHFSFYVVKPRGTAFFIIGLRGRQFRDGFRVGLGSRALVRI